MVAGFGIGRPPSSGGAPGAGADGCASPRRGEPRCDFEVRRRLVAAEGGGGGRGVHHEYAGGAVGGDIVHARGSFFNDALGDLYAGSNIPCFLRAGRKSGNTHADVHGSCHEYRGNCDEYAGGRNIHAVRACCGNTHADDGKCIFKFVFRSNLDYAGEE